MKASRKKNARVMGLVEQVRLLCVCNDAGGRGGELWLTNVRRDKRSTKFTPRIVEFNFGGEEVDQ